MTIDYKNIHTNNPNQVFMGKVISDILEVITTKIKDNDIEGYIGMVDHLSRTCESMKTNEFVEKWPVLAAEFKKRLDNLPKNRYGGSDGTDQLLILKEMADVKYQMLMHVIRDSSGEMHMTDEIGTEEDYVLEQDLGDIEKAEGDDVTS